MSLPTPLNNYGRKHNPGYTFEGSEDNEMIYNSLMRSNEKSGFVKEVKAKIAAIQKEYESRIPNLEIIKQWVEAIRSGEYLQEKRFLRATTNGKYFSVLGILLDISQDVTGGEWHGMWFVRKGRSFENWTKDGNSCTTIPWFARKALGLKELTVSYPVSHGKESSCLATLNENYNFDELADIIENEYLK